MLEIPAVRHLRGETAQPHVSFLCWQFQRIEKGELAVFDVLQDGPNREPRLEALRSAYHEGQAPLSIEEVIKLVKPKTCSAPLYYTFVVAGDCLLIVISIKDFPARDKNLIQPPPFGHERRCQVSGAISMLRSEVEDSLSTLVSGIAFPQAADEVAYAGL